MSEVPNYTPEQLTRDPKPQSNAHMTEVVIITRAEYRFLKKALQGSQGADETMAVAEPVRRPAPHP